MRIDVREIRRGAADESRVLFDCAAGIAAGVWRSSGEPRIGARYHVEFTLDRILSIGTNAERTDDRRSFARIDDIVTLNGFVESFDAERIGSFRFSADDVMLIDLADPRIDHGTWLRITAPIDEFDLYAFSE